MSNQKKADRYSCQTIHVNDLSEHLTHIAKLGMKYLVVDDGYRAGDCKVYIFFDDAGRENYLAGIYGHTADLIVSIISEGIGRGEHCVETLEKIKALLGYPQDSTPSEEPIE